jgi:hypothetical protein
MIIRIYTYHGAYACLVPVNYPILIVFHQLYDKNKSSHHTRADLNLNHSIGRVPAQAARSTFLRSLVPSPSVQDESGRRGPVPHGARHARVDLSRDGRGFNLL